MLKHYTHLLIRSDEDGNCVRFLDHGDVERLLRDPRGEYGVEKFMIAEDLHDGNLYPQMWGDAALLVKIEIVKVRPVTTAWAIDP